MQTAVDRLPGIAAIVGTESPSGGDRDEHPFSIGRIEQNCVQAHSAGTRLPLRSGLVVAQSGKLLPILSAVG